ncbi:pyridoxamine kinase [Dehalobacterium formicoaceticum]|uniref:pyridoxal kinase n=1 Tax=Dehalobacterium formicoaceticum TaxID=51515 RepID=A0ABT1Y6J9_9FIRM|nr:pyridoxamine kinase [Dehalobacterium formicoaceticum]MCR6546516.1 pyridoxamine kinase [Dehalobacterium formicoaceticum]
MKDQILLINDLPGYGKVALSAMIPVLSHMGFNLYNLPTALVSNTLDYGLFDILDTTDYMKNTLAVWEKLGFSFDAISTGFIVSEEQVGLIADFCRQQSRNGTKIFVDPIMGDDGKLYNGISEKTVTYMRELCKVSDYMIPNYTEAALLVGMEIKTDAIIIDEGHQLINGLREMGAKSVVITSILLSDRMAVLGYDAETDEYFTLPFEFVPVRFPGTGDIFSAVMMGKVLSGSSLKSSVQAAMDYIRKLIVLNKDNVDKYKGIPIEAWLGEMD